jgi:hypothetical protein
MPRMLCVLWWPPSMAWQVFSCCSIAWRRRWGHIEKSWQQVRGLAVIHCLPLLLTSAVYMLYWLLSC